MSPIRKSARLPSTPRRYDYKKPLTNPRSTARHSINTRTLDQPLNKAFTEGDIKIISADGMSFMISSYHLVSASASYSLDSGTKANTEISFIDPAIESSHAVYHFLSLITGKSLPCPTTTSLETMEQLLEFVNKYDCASAILTFTHLLKSFIQPTINPRALFALAATHDALEVCVQVIKTPMDWVYDAPKDRENEDIGQVVGGNVLDPSAMAWSDACTIPEKYYWGLVRAFRVVEGKVVKKEDWVKIGDEFERVMKCQAGKTSLGRL